MLFFMYISFILFIPIVILFKFQYMKLCQKNYTSDYLSKKLRYCVFIDILAGIIIYIIMVFAVPAMIWNFGEKAYQIEDQVTSTTSLYPIKISGNNEIYIKEANEDGAKKYEVNLKENWDEYDSKSTIIDENDVYKDDCKAQYINQYWVYELKGDNILIRNINDMFANIYVDNPYKKLDKKFIKICIPRNSVGKGLLSK